MRCRRWKSPQALSPMGRAASAGRVQSVRSVEGGARSIECRPHHVFAWCLWLGYPGCRFRGTGRPVNARPRGVRLRLVYPGVEF